MGYDRKYGEVITAHGSIPEDEPVVVFRGRDRILPALMNIYIELCDVAGSPQYHIDQATLTYEMVTAWQHDHPELVVTPTSERAREWLA
jgi:hypothetical protein